MDLSHFVLIETGLFLALLFAIVLLRTLTGSINTVGILDEKIRLPTGEVVRRKTSPERVQALVITLGIAAHFSSLVSTETSPTIPEVPPAMLTLIFASQLTYLGVKGRHLFRTPPAGRH